MSNPQSNYAALRLVAMVDAATVHPLAQMTNRWSLDDQARHYAELANLQREKLKAEGKKGIALCLAAINDTTVDIQLGIWKQTMKAEGAI